MPTHLEHYLSYYKTCDSPGYAVLVTGEWGTGKTYQVKKALPNAERYYVSLFGLQNTADVHSEVLAAVDPGLAKTKSILNRVGDTSKDMGGLFALGGLIPGIANAALRQDIEIDRVLIFDDLERCGLSLKDTLGVVNTYVEHHECRVVVIAHDGKLSKKFQEMKEKLFGQIIRVEPQVADAFDEFSQQLSSQAARNFINTHRKTIAGIFQDSGVQSLRVAKHLLEDLARLHDQLSADHKNHYDAMVELVGLFSALNIECRSGLLTDEDIRNRANIRHTYQMQQHGNHDGQPNKPRLLQADEKYSSVNLESNLLQDDAIHQMLIEGRYDQNVVANSLNNSSYFLRPEEAPPWKIVINFDELEDEVVEPALQRMQEQIDKLEITDSGEMLHVFALKLLMAENGALDDDVAGVVKSCIAYLDRLLAAELLPPRETDFRWRDKFNRSHGGYGYWLRETYIDQFNEILNHLIESREEAMRRQFPQITARLLELLGTDGQAFLEQVCITNNGENPYALIPILSHIPAATFVEAWMASPRENWRAISIALKSRYEAARLENELVAERDWAQEIVRLLETEAGQADGLQALRIERVIPENLQDVETV